MDVSIQSEFIRPADIAVNDSFWGVFMERVRGNVIPYQWKALNDEVPGAEPSYCIRNFKLAAELTHPELDYGVPRDIGFGGLVFQDSDLAKWIEAAAYSLVWHPDALLEKTLDETIDIICNAQQDDGYLDSYYIINGLEKRFTNLKDNHELYCLGHFIEGAVAYYEATGKRKLMDAMIRYVDCVDTHIGSEEGKLHGYPGHEIAEMALIRLYAVTKDQKHLKLAKYFIDRRGRQPLYFEEETARNGNTFYWKDSFVKYQYYQAGKPVRDQHVAEGHAVRAVYLYSGMADVARLSGDEELLAACRDLFANISKKQMYITGAIGQSAYGEAFSYDYDLPNDTVYAETCAAIGLAFFARRMASIAPKGEYADVIERTLFNSIISGMALDGKSFFYVNPLEVLPEASLKDRRMRHVKIERQKWFGCACCPPNLARILASLGSYVHSVNSDSVYTHLYMGSEAKVSPGGRDVKIKIETKYPWEGQVDISFFPAGKAVFTYGFRIPGWCKSCTVKLNGDDVTYTLRDGYALIGREWADGDRITVVFDMPVNLVETNPHVRNNAGRIAVTRGPLVYCLEEKDNGKELFKLHAGQPSGFRVKYQEDLLEGLCTVSFTGKKEKDWEDDALYRNSAEAVYEEKEFFLIPYYSWANRGEGEMTVWIHK
ncbi:MAG: glycoside hydrolase family 127 protein [Treponema sp.]|nr:glycoside hydrolase family 127 protein [Treponema sp.]